MFEVLVQVLLTAIFTTLMFILFNLSLNNERNPDEAEEDDIGPVEPTSYIESCIHRWRPLLIINLRQYYNNYAAIPVYERKRAIATVETIKRCLQKSVQDDLTNYIFGNIMPQGSSYEGLKVIESNEFDLLLPLMVNDGDWRCTEAAGRNSEYQSPGYFFITKIQGFVLNTKTRYDNAIVNDVYLSPIEVKRNMHSIVQRAVDKMAFLNVQRVNLRESGPALTLEVLYNGSQKMRIDIVPCIKISGKLLVAKRHPESDQYQCITYYNMFNYLWRLSFSEEEKAIIRKMDKGNECRRACLKILKTIRVKKGPYSPLKKLSSYHLKTCMLHLNADKGIESWHEDNLDDRFKDLLKKLIELLKDEKMPSFFDARINLFSANNTFQLQNIRGWLERIIRSDDKIIDEMLS